MTTEITKLHPELEIDTSNHPASPDFKAKLFEAFVEAGTPRMYRLDHSQDRTDVPCDRCTHPVDASQVVVVGHAHVCPSCEQDERDDQAFDELCSPELWREIYAEAMSGERQAEGDRLALVDAGIYAEEAEPVPDAWGEVLPDPVAESDLAYAADLSDYDKFGDEQ